MDRGVEMRTELSALLVSASATGIGAIMMVTGETGVLVASAVSLSVMVAGFTLALVSDETTAEG